MVQLLGCDGRLSDGWAKVDGTAGGCSTATRVAGRGRRASSSNTTSGLALTPRSLLQATCRVRGDVPEGATSSGCTCVPWTPTGRSAFRVPVCVAGCRAAGTPPSRGSEWRCSTASSASQSWCTPSGRSAASCCDLYRHPCCSRRSYPHHCFLRCRCCSLRRLATDVLEVSERERRPCGGRPGGSQSS